MERLVILLAAMLASPATASDAFQGVRVEVRAGHDTVRFDDRPNAPDAASGVSYGIGLGGDLRTGRLVAGLEAGVDQSSARHCFATAPGISFCEAAQRDVEAALRLGVAANEHLLVYGKAGYSNLRLRTEQRGSGTADFVGQVGNSGLRLGAGAEYRLGGRGYAKAEYRVSFHDAFGDRDGVRRHQTLVGVGMRF